jgi:proline racemase
MSDPRLSGIYGTIIYEDLGTTSDGIHQRNVTIFADGEVDRSPCGSGTSARIALLHAEGKLAVGDVLTHDSIVNSRFLGRIVGIASADGYDAVIPEVSGSAYPTGEHTFIYEEDDEVGLGFVFR